MNDNKTVIWTLIPNQYERTIYLILSNEPFYKIIKILNKKYNFNWKEELDFIKNDSAVAPITIVSKDTFKLAIILKDFNNSYNDYAILAHELYHVITYISKITNAKMNDITSEHWAYFLSFYMKCCAECLLEHIKHKD